MGTALGFGEPEGGDVAILPRPHNFIGCPSSKRNDLDHAVPDARFGANIQDPTQRMGSGQFPYEGMGIRLHTV